MLPPLMHPNIRVTSFVNNNSQKPLYIQNKLYREHTRYISSVAISLLPGRVKKGNHANLSTMIPTCFTKNKAER